MDPKRKRAPRRQRQVTEVGEAAIRLHIEALKEGGYVATSPDLPCRALWLRVEA